MTRPRRKQWSEAWEANIRIEADEGSFNAAGSLVRFTQSLPRSYAVCLRRLDCGHAGMSPATLWLFSVFVDLLRQGNQKLTQAEIINEAGLSRSNGKRAFSDLERGGFLRREPGRVVITIPAPELVRASLQNNCLECGSPARPLEAQEGRPGEAENYLTQPEDIPWSEKEWYQNLKRRVGSARAQLAVQWTEHRLQSGEPIHTPRGYAAAVAEVYAGRRAGYVGDRPASGEEVAAYHQAVLRELNHAAVKRALASDSESTFNALVEQGIFEEADAIELLAEAGSDGP